MNSARESPNIIRFLIANGLNTVGNTSCALAVPVLIYHLSHSALAMSLMITFAAIAILILNPFVGVLVDRWGARRIFLGALLFQAGWALVIPLLQTIHGLSMWVVYGVVVGDEVLGTLVGVAQFSVIRSTFESNRAQASARNTVVYTVSAMVGQALGGLIVQNIGYSAVFVLDALSCMAPIILLWRHLAGAHPSDISRHSPWQDFKSGVHTVWSNNFLRQLILLLGTAELVDANVFSVVVIFYLRSRFHLSPSVIGIVIAFKGGGLFLGSLMAARLPSVALTRFFKISQSGVLLSLSLFLIPYWEVVPVALFGFSSFRKAAIVRQNMILQETVSRNSIGRVNSMARTGRMLPATFTPSVYGWVIGAFGPVAVAGVMLSASVIPFLMLFKPGFLQASTQVISESQPI